MAGSQALVPTVLADRQIELAREYVRDFSVTRAAKACRLDPKTARKWLALESFQKEIERQAEIRLKGETYAKDTIIRRILDVVDGDVRDLVDEHGHFRPLTEISVQTARAIEAFEAIELPEGHRIIRCRTIPRAKALELGARHFGMLLDRVQMNVTQTILPQEDVAILDDTELEEVIGLVGRINTIVEGARNRAVRRTSQPR